MINILDDAWGYDPLMKSNQLPEITVSDKVYVRTPYNERFIARIRQIPGRKWDPEQKVWVVPKEHEESVRRLVSQFWSEAEHPRYPAGTPQGGQFAPKPKAEEAKLPKETYLLPETPYNAEFIERIKELGGRWSRWIKRWEVPSEAAEQAKALVAEFFPDKKYQVGHGRDVPRVDLPKLPSTMVSDLPHIIVDLGGEWDKERDVWTVPEDMAEQARAAFAEMVPLRAAEVGLADGPPPSALAHLPPTPYNPEFMKRVKELGGRWDKRSKDWRVPQDKVKDAEELFVTYFPDQEGLLDVGDDTVAIEKKYGLPPLKAWLSRYELAWARRARAELVDRFFRDMDPRQVRTKYRNLLEGLQVLNDARYWRTVDPHWLQDIQALATRGVMTPSTRQRSSGAGKKK